jgi:hypothetical protein
VQSGIELSSSEVGVLETNQVFEPKDAKINSSGTRRVYLEQPIEGWVTWRDDILQVSNKRPLPGEYFSH